MPTQNLEIEVPDKMRIDNDLIWSTESNLRRAIAENKVDKAN
jgi:hypothetical protein